MEANNGFEYILLEDLRADLIPLSRLASYLALRYKVQAKIRPTWMGQNRPRGFFDLLRNIQIITDEDDLQGLVVMTIRVRPRFLEDEYFQESGMYPIPEVPFNEVGRMWLIEIVEIALQHEQILSSSEIKDIDLEHSLPVALNRIGLAQFSEEESESLYYKSTGAPVTVDDVMKTFLLEKPGAKSYPCEVWSAQETDEQSP